MNRINWQSHSFDELSVAQLYHILQLRSEVFVVEQDCVYQDMDNLDQRSIHLVGYQEDQLVAYARIIPPGKKYVETSLGRIVSSPALRRKGIGKALVNKAIDYCKDAYPNSSIKISAQCYLDAFYQSFGFKIVSEVYLEDGIDHREMLLEN